MKQTTSVMRLRTLGAVSAALMATLTGVRAEAYDFLGSAPGNWVVYAGANSVPNLVTTTPGSIVDNVASGSSYGRLNTTFGSFSGSWRVGDTYAFHFDGVVSNSTVQIEFTSGGAAAGSLLGLRMTINNNAASGGDFVLINALGGSSSLLFSGNFGGGAGVGSAQRVLADITLSIGAGTATVSGSVADGLGNLWTGPNTTINLGTAPASLFAGMNVNAGGGISAINTLNWTLTPVPEPSTVALLAGLGLAGFIFRRRLK